MEREIKFRALDLGNDLIHNVFQIEFFEDGHIIVNEDIPIKKLIEYTGLKDKNGVEIYEGDIVERVDTGDTYSIMWHIDRCLARAVYDAWLDKNVYGREYDTRLSSLTSYEVEIIGNVFENPKLLNEKAVKK